MTVAEISGGEDLAPLVGQMAILHRASAAELGKRVHLDYLDGFSRHGKESPSYRLVRVNPGVAATARS